VGGLAVMLAADAVQRQAAAARAASAGAIVTATTVRRYLSTGGSEAGSSVLSCFTAAGAL
jgi:hypothetical protein